MERSLTFFVFDKTPEKIKDGIIKIFESWNFTMASGEPESQYSTLSERFNLHDRGLLPRAFLISPQELHWCFIVPSYEVWLSEAVDICNLLSDEINCSILVLLQDDDYGWGYYLCHNGKIIDKFHTDPSSPSLYERQSNPPESFWMESSQIIDITPDEKEQYGGNPDIIAKAFDVQSEKITHYFSITRNYSGSMTHYEMVDFVEKGLGIPKGWNSLSYNDIYQRKIENIDQWLNLIFVRKMTPIETEWYEMYGEDFPETSPPLWLAE
jgi:hypothetical protein